MVMEWCSQSKNMCLYVLGVGKMNMLKEWCSPFILGIEGVEDGDGVVHSFQEQVSMCSVGG